MELPTLHKDEEAILRLRALYERYGYTKYKMSKFEEYDFYARNKSFLQTGSILTFHDLSGRLMALKPDVTLSIVKNAAGRGTEKLYYNENVYRADGREFREIMQVGLECIGDLDRYAVAEVTLLAEESLRTVGGRYLLDLSHVGMCAGLLAETNLPEEDTKALTDRIAAKNTAALTEYCAARGVSADLTGKLAALAALYGPFEEILPQARALSVNETTEASLDALEELYGLLRRLGGGGSVNLDFSLRGDMSYYSGVIFQGFLEGLPRAVLTGGQYDNLLHRMGREGGAIGFAVSLDLLERLGNTERPYDVDTLVCYEDGTDPALLAETVRELTAAGRTLRVSRTGAQAVRARETITLTGGKL